MSNNDTQTSHVSVSKVIHGDDAKLALHLLSTKREREMRKVGEEGERVRQKVHKRGRPKEQEKVIKAQTMGPG